MPNIESLSKELKTLVGQIDLEDFICLIADYMQKGIIHSVSPFGPLESPLRDLYYLVGLRLSSKIRTHYIEPTDEEMLERIGTTLRQLSHEYSKSFLSEKEDELEGQIIKDASIAMPTYFKYFHQGPLDYEEQKIDWIRSTFSPYTDFIKERFGFTVGEFLIFYDELDNLIFQKTMHFHSPKMKVPEEWISIARKKVELNDSPEMPFFFREMLEDQFKNNLAINTAMANPGIHLLFKYSELSLHDKISSTSLRAIRNQFETTHSQFDFLFYSSPDNPALERPLININRDDLFLAFEVKQLLHSFETKVLSEVRKEARLNVKVNKKRGQYLEDSTIALLEKFFPKDTQIYHSYYVDGKEQDILVLHKNFALIIEVKGYEIREPFRDRSKAAKRITQDFNKSIAAGYNQSYRVESKFWKGEKFPLQDKHGNTIHEVDPKDYEDNDYSIIITLDTFGILQMNLNMLLTKPDINDALPWSLKFFDLEVFLLALIKLKKSPEYFFDFLRYREQIHDLVIASDELEICGAYISNKLPKEQKLKHIRKIILAPEDADVFDELYKTGLGFENERYLEYKNSPNYRIF